MIEYSIANDNGQIVWFQEFNWNKSFYEKKFSLLKKRKLKLDLYVNINKISFFDNVVISLLDGVIVRMSSRGRQLIVTICNHNSRVKENGLKIVENNDIVKYHDEWNNLLSWCVLFENKFDWTEDLF